MSSTPRSIGRIDNGSATALAFLAFVAVIREGVETSLFLTGQAAAASADGGAIWVLVGAVIGIAIAALLGVGFYHGSRRINLATFFRWTGVALVFIAAGLLSHAVHELIEIGVINIGTQTLFDISSTLPHEGDGSIIGQMLARAVRLHLVAGGHHLRRLADLHRGGADALPAPGQVRPGAAGTGFGAHAGPDDQDHLDRLGRTSRIRRAGSPRGPAGRRRGRTGRSSRRTG